MQSAQCGLHNGIKSTLFIQSYDAMVKKFTKNCLSIDSLGLVHKPDRWHCIHHISYLGH